jgi:hypothetical protein
MTDDNSDLLESYRLLTQALLGLVAEAADSKALQRVRAERQCWLHEGTDIAVADFIATADGNFTKPFDVSLIRQLQIDSGCFSDEEVQAFLLNAGTQ